MLFQKSSRLWPSHVSNLNFYIFFSRVHLKMSESYKRLASNQLSSTLTQIGCGLPMGPSAALRVRKPWVTLSLRGTAAVRASRSVAAGAPGEARCCPGSRCVQWKGHRGTLRPDGTRSCRRGTSPRLSSGGWAPTARCRSLGLVATLSAQAKVPAQQPPPCPHRKREHRSRRRRRTG